MSLPLATWHLIYQTGLRVLLLTWVITED